jgi:hypothetical protein
MKIAETAVMSYGRIVMSVGGFEDCRDGCDVVGLSEGGDG